MTTFPRTPLTLPPLENGDALAEPLRDRLSRAEFERRYTAMPDTKAELIEGVVYVASPVRLSRHGRPHSLAVLQQGLQSPEHQAFVEKLQSIPSPAQEL
jgi:hypothetical protein